MESLLFALLVLISGLYLSGFFPVNWKSYLLAGLLIVCRPEGVAVLGMLVISRLLEPSIFRHSQFVNYLLFIACSILFLILARFILFSEILPNTYFAKSPVVSEGVKYLYRAFLYHWWFGLVFLLGFLGAVFGDYRHRLIFIFAVVWTVIPVLEGGDWMYLLRFFMPAMVLLCVAMTGIFNSSIKLLYVVASVLIFIIAVQSYATIRRTHVLADNYYSNDVLMIGALQQWLSSNNIDVVASVDIGQLFYKSDLTVVDLAGLTDKRISRLPGGHLGKNIPVDYLDECSVDVVLLRLVKLPLNGEAVDKSFFDNYSEYRLSKNEKFLERFRLLAIVPYPDQRAITNFAGYAVMVRSNSAHTVAPLPAYKMNGYVFVDYPSLD